MSKDPCADPPIVDLAIPPATVAEDTDPADDLDEDYDGNAAE